MQTTVTKTIFIFYIRTKGQESIIFKDGKRINGTWEKDSRTARTIIRDASGSQIKFDRGLFV